MLDRANLAAFVPMRLPACWRRRRRGGAGAGRGDPAAADREPLASPEVLGVSGGASLGYAAVVFGLAALARWRWRLGRWRGALALAVLVAFTARRDMPAERVLLAGIAVSALASAVLSAMMAVGDARAWAILSWLSGSAAAVPMAGAVALAALAVAVWLATLALRRWLALLPLGAGSRAAWGWACHPHGWR
ncbi:iron chelate uptake ABC transporter family permease subunit (plasmid) [Paracoccus marcusii]|nr:iron chelate uptake ABC transporter family permease subunit [Paracoccus marcusii]